MHRLALNQLTTLRWSLEEDLAAYRACGVAAIGVSWRKLLENGVQKSVRKIQKSELPVSNVGWVGGFTGHNGFALDEVMFEAKRAIRVAAQLKARTVTVVTGPQNRHIDSHAARLLRWALVELADLAGSYQVKLALQPMHSVYEQNWSFLHTVDEAVAVIEKVNHPALKLALGTYHVGDENDLLEKIREHIDLIGVVHLGDRNQAPRNENDREIPGEGQLPLREIIHTLEAAGYGGWYETEVWSQELWKLDHHDLLERCLRSQSDLFSTEFSRTISKS